MQDITMVVARYNEGLAWLDFMPKNINVIIYNKGPDIVDRKILDNPIITVVDKCHNTGRETETYLRHIVKEYDKLSDIVIFTQGNPLDHSPNFSHLVYGIANGSMEESVYPLSIRWNEYLPPPKVLESSSTPYFIEKASRYTLSPVRHWDDGINHTCDSYRNLHDLPHGEDVIHHFCNLISLPDLDFGKTDFFNFFYCGIFAVKKEAIMKHSLNFYFNCHSIANKHESHGFMFERIWWKMFSD
jgi:hypothetical protein